MANKINHSSKKWLSPATTAFIFTQLQMEDGFRYGTLKMGDCSRIVNFDIEVSNVKDRNDTSKKIDIMIKELTAFNEQIKAFTYGA